MPKQITFIADGPVEEFDSVSCWSKQWVPDGSYEARGETLVYSLGDTVRPPGRSPTDNDACDPACVE